jgi:Domain of unknown function (DUF5666)
MSINHDEEAMSASASDPFPFVSQKRRRGVRVTTAAAVALGLAVSGGAVANAATSASPSSSTAPGTATPAGVPPNPAGMPPFGGTHPAAVGTVKSLGTGTFTLTTPDGTIVTVDVDSSTTYLDRQKSSPSIADVTVGAHVAVFGTDTANTVTATKVAIGGPPDGVRGAGMPPFGGTPPAAVGTVKSLGTGTFTLSTPDGTTVTVDVDSSTTYLDRQKSSPSIADVTVGAHVAVFGTDTANTVTATKVAIGGPPNGSPTPRGFGGPGPWSGRTSGTSSSGSASSPISGSSTS